MAKFIVVLVYAATLGWSAFASSGAGIDALWSSKNNIDAAVQAAVK